MRNTALPQSRIREIGWSVVIGRVLRLPLAVLRARPLTYSASPTSPTRPRSDLSDQSVAWLDSQPPTEIEELRGAVGDVVYGLADLGWGPQEIRYLDEDRDQLVAMLRTRNLVSRVRAPR